MKKSVVFIGWTRPAVGRESAAMEHFQYAMNYFGKQKASGTIDSFEPVLLGSHGGDLNGFILIQGNQDKLDALLQTDDWRDLEVKSNYLLQGHGVLRGVMGAELQTEMARYGKIISGR